MPQQNLVKLVNSKYTQTIADILEVRNRSKKEEYELTKNRVAKVGKSEAFAYERKDAVGTKQADTGTAMFYNEKKPKDGNAMTFVHFIDDLKESGYNLIDLYSYQKDGDKMSFICFSFNRKESDGFPSKVNNLLKQLAAKSWEHVHIWDNPNGSITVNAAHLTEQQVPAIRMERTNENGMLTGSDERAPKEGIYFSF
jgi:hypothetical protein